MMIMMMMMIIIIIITYGIGEEECKIRKKGNRALL